MPHPKVGHKNPEYAGLFYDVDPEKYFYDLREIGHGSFGAVFYARSTQSKDVVAIKKMLFSGKNSNEKWQDIVKEVQFFVGLNHENCVKYHGCYIKDHTAWLVMDYCLGSASDILEVHKKPLAEMECAAITHGALVGLAYLHKNNRIHRDIKAGNILLSERGVVKLADFGSASMISPANSFVGTPYWMSPEVILAMDEGQYDGKVDIWSIGITCIELAERKPPLFNMNAMSALYHIAQNDPPQLSSNEWSSDFKDFVAKCLAKQPGDRPSADNLLKEPFLSRPRAKNTLLELIERTKNSVRALDKANYNRMKMIMSDSEVDGPSDEVSSIKQTSARNGHAGGDGRLPSLEGDIQDLSLTSLESSFGEDSSFTRSREDINVSKDSLSSSTEDIFNISNDSQLTFSEDFTCFDKSLALASTEDISICEDLELENTDNFTSFCGNPLPSIIITNCEDSHLTRSTEEVVNLNEDLQLTSKDDIINASDVLQLLEDLTTSLENDTKNLSLTSHGSSVSEDSPLASTEDISKVGGAASHEGPWFINTPISDDVTEDRFATLRPAQMVAKQLQEHQSSDAYREQLQVYKRLRQQHQKLIIQLEQRQQQEMYEHRKALEREFENQMHTFDKEMEKLKTKHRQELEQKVKQSMSDEKKLTRQIKDQQDGELRQVSSQVKNEYKKAKQQLKQDESNKRASLTQSQLKEQYTFQQRQQESQKSDEHKHTMDEELRRFRREQLALRQALEKHLLIEEMNTLQAQKDQAHNMLLRHHDCTQDLEYKQLHAMHKLRKEQQGNLHQTEVDNQNEYNKKAEMELQKKHLLEIRQRPKTLKAQELKVKKQFNETRRIQERQYRMLRKQMLANAPSEKHPEIIKKFKEDRIRKFNELGSQYDQSISDLLQKQKVRLDEIQLTELEALRIQLKQEQDVLHTYQTRQAAHLRSHIENELQELENRVALRKALLEERMIEESTRLQDIRLERLRDLQNRHQSELAEFDAVSRRHLESPRTSSRNLSHAQRGSPRVSRAFNQGSPRNSNRSLGTPTSRFQQPNRDSSISMTSLHSSNSSRSSVSSQYAQPSANNTSRNGGAPGDRRSYYEQPSNRR